MNENPVIEPSETPRQPPAFWKLFLAGTGMALLGNIAGWLTGGCMLLVLADDYVMEGYALLTIFLSWTLVPVMCLLYGLLAAWLMPKTSRKRGTNTMKSTVLTGFLLGLFTWILLGGIAYLAVEVF
jgi:membrane protein implicated in regulation of membrane protease activity